MNRSKSQPTQRSWNHILSPASSTNSQSSAYSTRSRSMSPLRSPRINREYGEDDAHMSGAQIVNQSNVRREMQLKRQEAELKRQFKEFKELSAEERKLDASKFAENPATQKTSPTNMLHKPNFLHILADIFVFCLQWLFILVAMTGLVASIMRSDRDNAFSEMEQHQNRFSWSQIIQPLFQSALAPFPMKESPNSLLWR